MSSLHDIYRFRTSFNSKQILQKRHEKIWVDSTSREGTEFFEFIDSLFATDHKTQNTLVAQLNNAEDQLAFQIQITQDLMNELAALKKKFKEQAVPLIKSGRKGKPRMGPV